MTDLEMLHTLRRYCIAYDQDDRATIGKLYSEVIQIGEELNRRGGIEEMKRIWNQLDVSGDYLPWDGMGDWIKYKR